MASISPPRPFRAIDKTHVSLPDGLPEPIVSDIEEHLQVTDTICDYSEAAWDIDDILKAKHGNPTYLCLRSNPDQELRAARYVAAFGQILVVWVPEGLGSATLRPFVITKVADKSGFIQNYRGRPGVTAQYYSFWSPVQRRFPAYSNLDVARVTTPKSEPNAPISPPLSTSTSIPRMFKRRLTDDGSYLKKEDAHNDIEDREAKRRRLAPLMQTLRSASVAGEFVAVRPRARVGFPPPESTSDKSFMEAGMRVAVEAREDPDDNGDLEDGEIPSEQTGLKAAIAQGSLPSSDANRTEIQISCVAENLFTTLSNVKRNMLAPIDDAAFSRPSTAEPRQSVKREIGTGKVLITFMGMDMDGNHEVRHQCFLEDCYSAKLLYEEACIGNIATAKTRLFEVKVEGFDARRIRPDDQTAFEQVIMLPVVSILEEKETVEVIIKHYL